MARTAIAPLLLGDHGELQPGNEIPATFTVGGGPEHKTDFERLEALGLVEPVKRSRAKTDES